MSKQWLSVLSLSVLILLFQNCSPQGVQFEKTKTDMLSLEGELTSSPIDEGLGEINSEFTLSISSEITGQPEDYDVVYDSCLTFVELVERSIVLPKRDASGICYYVKIVSTTPLHPSGSFGERQAFDVISANHSGSLPVRDPKLPKSKGSPFVIADIQLSLLSSTQWQVAISGSYSDPHELMMMDNFLLLEMKHQNQDWVWGYGTKDSLPISVQGVDLNDFYDFAPSGTAHVPAIPITSSVPLLRGQSVDLRIRALDCGGSAQASDIYLVFY